MRLHPPPELLALRPLPHLRPTVASGLGREAFRRGQLAGDEAGAASLFSRSHSPAITASWCSPSTSWSSVTAFAKSPHLLAERGGDRLRRVPATLRADPRQVELVIGGIGSERVARRGGACATACARSRRARRSSRSSRSCESAKLRRTRRVDELVEQREVAVGPHRRAAARRGRARVARASLWSSCLPSSMSDCGSSASRASSRSCSTSVSRTAPRIAPSHFNSTRIGSLHVSSSTARKVRRSDRKRRVATLAWCTCSGSVPRRTPGSLTSSRRVDVGDRRLHHLGRRGREVERRRRGDVGWIGGARSERAHDLRHRIGMSRHRRRAAGRRARARACRGPPPRAPPRARGTAPRGGCRRATTPRRRRLRRSSCPARRAARRACAPC